MGGHQGHSERSAGQAHGKIPDARAGGEKFRLAWERVSNFVQGFFGDGSRDHSPPVAGRQFRGGDFQGIRRRARRSGGGPARQVSQGLAHHFKIHPRREVGGLQRGAHHLGADPRRITHRDANNLRRHNGRGGSGHRLGGGDF